MVAVIEPMKPCKLLGAYATVAGVRGALPLLHSPCGCQYYLRACLLLHDGIDPCILTSDISQQEVIFGGQERLREAILASQAAYDPDLIMVLSSCAPALVGDDIQAVADSVADQVAAEILVVDCGGFGGDQTSGFRDVMLKLLAHFASDRVNVRQNVVNLIGMIPGYDYRWRFDVASLVDTLAAAGLEVNAVLGGLNSAEQLRDVGCAELNIVLSSIRGLEIARYLERRFGTPFIQPPFLPIGMDSIGAWLKLIAPHVSDFDWSTVGARMDQALRPLEYADLALVTTWTVHATAVISAEPGRALGLTRFLTQDFGMSVTGICATESDSRTGALLADALTAMGNGHCRIVLDPDAFALRALIADLKPQVIYGSTFERPSAVQVGASLIKIGYPTYDEVLLTERPYMGFQGIGPLVEDLTNVFMRREL